MRRRRQEVGHYGIKQVHLCTGISARYLHSKIHPQKTGATQHIKIGVMHKPAVCPCSMNRGGILIHSHPAGNPGTCHWHLYYILSILYADAIYRTDYSGGTVESEMIDAINKETTLDPNDTLQSRSFAFGAEDLIDEHNQVVWHLYRCNNYINYNDRAQRISTTRII